MPEHVEFLKGNIHNKSPRFEYHDVLKSFAFMKDVFLRSDEIHKLLFNGL